MLRCRELRVDLGAAPGRRTVLDGVSLDVHDGEVLAVLGRSGVGKSTLLRVLGGLAPATAGVVEHDGRAVAAPPPDVVVVFQDHGRALLPWRTVERNVALGLEGRVSRREQRERVADALALVRLDGRGDDRPGALSGGQQQRVQLARALALRPRVLLLDEPFGALDALTREELRDELLRVREELDLTVVVVTHDVDEAVYLADRALVLTGTPASVGTEVRIGCARPRHRLDTPASDAFHRARRALHGAVTLTSGAAPTP